MKPIAAVLFFFFTTAVLFSLTAQNRCASSEYRHQLHLNNPNWQESKAEQETLISEWINENRNGIGARSVMKIPIVVHVVWHNQEENIPDEQINSQIAILNQDYRKMNSEIPQFPLYFNHLSQM